MSRLTDNLPVAWHIEDQCSQVRFDDWCGKCFFGLFLNLSDEPLGRNNIAVIIGIHKTAKRRREKPQAPDFLRKSLSAAAPHRSASLPKRFELLRYG